MSTYSITAAGSAALDMIQHAEKAFVMGLTSRGIFCATGNEQVFFLSYEGWRGPLTVNLNLGEELAGMSRYLTKEQRSHPTTFDRLIHGSTVRISAERIHFEDENITILCAGIPAWKADLTPLHADGFTGARRRLVSVANKVLEEGRGAGWIGHIPRWAGCESSSRSDDVFKGLENDLEKLADGLRTGNGEDILLRIGRLLGRGTGLTPSGDDFVIGLLLGLRATFEIAPGWAVVSELSRELLYQARQKTTTLSANLMACALEGQADERLVTALDGILWDNLPADECAWRLLNYGGSSGGDSLLGMALALSLV